MPLSDAHIDGETLALEALGEDAGTSADDQHLAACARCQAELDQLRAVVATSRSLSPEDRPVDPPQRVWQAITAELGSSHTGHGEGSVAVLSDVRQGAVAQSDSDGTGVATGTGGPGQSPPAAPPATVTSLDERRRSRWQTAGLLVAACAASLAVGIAGTAVVTRDSGSQPAAPDVIAQTSLAALPDHTGQGTAKIVTRNGADYLSVDTSGLTPADGFYEVWLIDPKTFQMVGLGALEQDQGLFAVPPGLDLSKYRVVDVSIEPFDGDPLHSRNSVVRGQLTV